jgi:NAD(P)-dependent dehydrogenase (short-subunit alcohol dehydrogenase family)
VNRSCVVTGAANGLGLATAALLRERGWEVVGLDVDEAGLRRAATEVGLVPVVGSITDWAAHERAAEVAAGLARLGGWINNAAIDLQGAAHEVDPEHVSKGLDVLLQGPMFGLAVAVRHMLPHGAGSIVTVSSIQAVATFPRYFVYGAAKAALMQATRSVAVDYGSAGIRCNAVLPGTIDTPMLDIVLPAGVSRDEAVAREGELSPMGRVAAPAEVANAVAFLLSDEASYISGAMLTVDGASTARCFAYPPLEL